MNPSKIKELFGNRKMQLIALIIIEIVFFSSALLFSMFEYTGMMGFCFNDADDDGFCDHLDNCESVYNPGQNDTDYLLLPEDRKCFDGKVFSYCDCDDDKEHTDDEDNRCCDSDNDGVCDIGDDEDEEEGIRYCGESYLRCDCDDDGECGDDEDKRCSDDDDDGYCDDNLCYGDGVGDLCDNCPNHYNPGQEDSDEDGTGDVCDEGCDDTDEDGICDEDDNCLDVYNPGQSDTDYIDVPDCDYECAECDGKVKNLTLKYLGDDSAIIKVVQKKNNIVVFEDNVDSNGVFSFSGEDKKGTFGTEIKIYVDDEFDVKIHTSCSQPIYTGMITGDFEIIDGYSRNGGRMCDIDGSQDCTGDGVGDLCDNCPNHYNPGQEDSDEDGTGDVCEESCSDSDEDGVCDEDDNCPDVYNPDQEDSDNLNCSSAIYVIDSDFELSQEGFNYYDDLYHGTNKGSCEAGQREQNTNCAHGRCLAVDLNINSYCSNGALSGGWKKTIDIIDDSEYMISFNYTLRLDTGAESDEYIRLQYRNITDGSLVDGPKIIGNGNSGNDDYLRGTISYISDLFAGSYDFDAGCYLNKITVSSENAECWIDDIIIEKSGCPDGIGNECDNCPNHYNPGQEDSDEDGTGDMCEEPPCTDSDDDGVCDDEDNCPNHYNPGQEDSDDDGRGDVCENACKEIYRTPTKALLHYGSDVTHKVNYSDNIRAYQSVGSTSSKYIYLNWTDNGIPMNSTIDNVLLGLEHKEYQIEIKVDWYNSSWVQVCDPPERSSDTLDYCDLTSYLDSPQKADNVSLRLNLTKTGSCHENLDLAFLNITYCNDNMTNVTQQCPTDAKIRFDFFLINNTGAGNMNNSVYTGLNSTKYDEGLWIDLTDGDGNIITDSGVVDDVPGLAFERGLYWVYISLWGHHPLWNTGWEKADGRITFNDSQITAFTNHYPGPVDNQGDYVYADAAGQDEVFWTANSTISDFYLTVRPHHDSYYLNYTCIPPDDIIPPVIDLESPGNNTVFNISLGNSSSILFEYNASDDDSDIFVCELIINGTVYETDYSITNGMIQDFTETLEEGSYGWSVNCTDIHGNEGESKTWYFNITTPVEINDTTPPAIELINPPNGSIFNYTDMEFEYNVTDNGSNISFCELIINGIIYQTDYGIIDSISQFFNQTLAEGSYIWSINCTDDFGNEGVSDEWEFEIVLPVEINDTTPPVVGLISPQNNSTDTDGWVTFIYNVTDNESDIAYCILIIDGSIYQTDYSAIVNTTNGFGQTLGNGYYLWSVNCTDIHGNEGESEEWALLVNKTDVIINGTGVCCCNLDVTTSPRIANTGEKTVIAADVSVAETGLPATPAYLNDINVTVYRVENNTQVVVVDNQQMTFLDDGLWYYSVDQGFDEPGNYIASVTMITNDTSSFFKQTSYTFSVRDTGSGLNIEGVSPDLINKDELTRLAAEVHFDGKPIDKDDLSSALLQVIKVNGTTQYYNMTTGLNIDNGILYVDGSFNETGVYYLNWTADYSGETRSAKEIVVIVGWEDKLDNISIDINSSIFQEIISLINENKNHLVNLLESMEYMEEFTQEEIFLITDSVNSMTDIVGYLEKGEITPKQAEDEFAVLQARLEKELGSKLIGGAVSPVRVEPDRGKVIKTLIVIIIVLLLLTIIIGGRKIVTIRETNTGVKRFRENFRNVNRRLKEMKILDTIYNLMQIRKIRIYLAITIALLVILMLLKMTPTFTGLAVEDEITGSFVLQENKGAGLINSAVGFGVLICTVMLLLMGLKKTGVKMKMMKEEEEERNRSIEQLLMKKDAVKANKEEKDRTRSRIILKGKSINHKDTRKEKKIEEKEHKKIEENTEAKESMELKKKFRGLSRNFFKEKKTKIKVLGNNIISSSKGITPKHFEPDETVFKHNQELFEKKCAEMSEKKYKKADIGMTKTGMLTCDIKQQIINAGLDSYLDKHAEKPKAYINIPVKRRKQKERLIKVFKLSDKDDFYPIVDCMRENEHIILITAGRLLEKDPGLFKRFTRQLDYVGMVYDARLAALDEKSFAIIPGFARFEK